AWPSETKVCKVNNNLKLPEFNSIRSLIKSKTNSDIYFLFKRIIFDGISTGRLEIGFEIKTMDEMANWEDYDWLFSKVLEQTVLFHGQRKTLIGLGSEFSRS